MIQIKFLDYEVQNAVYTVACKYEGFTKPKDIDDVKEYFWEQVDIQRSIEFGLEQAISDFILMQNDFDVDAGRYKDIVNRYQMEVMKLEHYEN